MKVLEIKIDESVGDYINGEKEKIEVLQMVTE